MPAPTKSCPKCIGTMHFRLGEYECDQCGHTEPPEAPKVEPEEAPRIRRREQWERAVEVRSGKPASPWPGESSADHRGEGRLPGTAPVPPSLYGVHEHYESAERQQTEPLAVEKTIYFTIYVVLFGLMLLIPFVSPVAYGGPSIGGFLGGLAGGGITLVVLWFVLFSAELWAKWCCGLWTLASIVLLVGLAFWFISTMQSLAPRFAGYGMHVTGALGGFFWLFVALQLVWHCWLLSILWRDVQRLRSE